MNQQKEQNLISTLIQTKVAYEHFLVQAIAGQRNNDIISYQATLNTIDDTLKWIAKN
jgi:hypothetical protein